MSETEDTQQVPVDPALVAQTKAPAEPVAAKPARVFTRTRFPKLPVLTDADFKKRKMRPQDVAAYKAAKKHEDDWGHLPPQVQEKLQGVDPKDVSDNAVEKHAKTRATDPVHFAAAKAFHRWGMHQELSLEAYDAAIEATLNEKHGS